MQGINALAYCDEVAVTKKEKVLTEVLNQVENTPQGTKALAYFARVVVTKKKSLKDRKCLWGTNAPAYFVKVEVTFAENA